jgi:hypothetical protein
MDLQPGRGCKSACARMHAALHLALQLSSIGGELAIPMSLISCFVWFPVAEGRTVLALNDSYQSLLTFYLLVQVPRSVAGDH